MRQVRFPDTYKGRFLVDQVHKSAMCATFVKISNQDQKAVNLRPTSGRFPYFAIYVHNLDLTDPKSRTQSRDFLRSAIRKWDAEYGIFPNSFCAIGNVFCCLKRAEKSTISPP
jgi:hypothetical protein